jgi:hypothetical protein
LTRATGFGFFFAAVGVVFVALDVVCAPATWWRRCSGMIVWVVAALEAVWFIASVTKPSARATAARTPAITIPRRWALPVTLVLSAGNACA